MIVWNPLPHSLGSRNVVSGLVLCEDDEGAHLLLERAGTSTGSPLR